MSKDKVAFGKSIFYKNILNKAAILCYFDPAPF